MSTVVLVIHLMICLGLIAVVLLQRSEGGALGIGGGGGGGGLVSGRGAADLLTRTTSILAALFFATSLILTILAKQPEGSGSLIDRLGQQPVSGPSAPAGDADKKAADGAAEKLKPLAPVGPSVPKSE